MTNWKDNQGDERDFESDPLDRDLDAALAKYASVEPRAGLEQRIFANLRTEEANVPDRSWLRWGTATAIASLIIIAAFLAWRSSRLPQPVALQLPSATTLTAQTTGPRVVPNAIPLRRATPKREFASHLPNQPVIAAAPKLDQFPSPQPLSEQELALARYVQSFPREATLIAQAQQEFELEIQKEMNATGPEARTSGSIQEER